MVVYATNASKPPSDEGGGPKGRRERKCEEYFSPPVKNRLRRADFCQPPRHTHPQVGVQSATARRAALSAEERGPRVQCILAMLNNNFPR